MQCNPVRHHSTRFTPFPLLYTTSIPKRRKIRKSEKRIKPHVQTNLSVSDDESGVHFLLTYMLMYSIGRNYKPAGRLSIPARFGSSKDLFWRVASSITVSLILPSFFSLISFDNITLPSLVFGDIKTEVASAASAD